ncbi:restriction endonuclease subunit S [Priestia megaterium]|uniref:restriction endonuclease subunit S n=1 Tax=Priestia megaterium TaxID=1404 RepID=UPI001ADF199B|nr:restriction endonuclease subunit S [Priestia megaterium]
MLGILNSYYKYKDSGIPWLGNIPTHWEVRRNRKIFTQRNQTGFPDLPILEVSLKTGVRVRDLNNLKRKQVMSDREKYKRAVKGDITYNMMRMWQGAVGVAPVDGLISPAYIVASPLPEVDSRYYSYLFRTDVYKNEINKYSRGIVSDRNRLYWDEFKQMPSPFPPKDEQKNIADFLDSYSRKVERLILNKRKLIELLNEQKIVVINQAVTKGIDTVQFIKTESNFPWKVEIPPHWDLLRGKQIFQYKKEINNGYKRDNVLSLTLRGVVNNNMENPEGLTPQDYSTYQFFNKGDLVFKLIDLENRQTSRVGLVHENGIMSPAYIRLIPKSSMNIRFFYYQYFDLYLRGIFNQLGAGVRSMLNPSDLLDLPLAVPPLSEQDRITDFLDNALYDLERAVKQTQREINLVEEYLQSLINEVVLGRIDIRHLAVEMNKHTSLLEGIDESESLVGDEHLDIGEEDYEDS